MSIFILIQDEHVNEYEQIKESEPKPEHMKKKILILDIRLLGQSDIGIGYNIDFVTKLISE